MADLVEEEAVRHFIKCLGEVHDNEIRVLASLEAVGNFVDQTYQLALAGPLLPEAVLLGADDLVGLSKVRNAAHKDVFKHFADDGCQGDGTIIFWHSTRFFLV